MSEKKHLRRINAVAPIRICDIGGWTDTWFAEFGSVFNIAVYPYVEVQITPVPIDEHAERVFINVENYDDHYVFKPLTECEYGKHPLIESAIGEMNLPEDIAFSVNIFSTAPPGASTGTSAAVSIALIGALDKLTDGCLTAHEASMMAHDIETNRLQLQCGIQDQLASAYGGINYIQMMCYPHAVVSPVMIPDAV